MSARPKDCGASANNPATEAVALVDRNPQRFVDIYHAKESDYEKATQRVFRSIEMPSSVKVLVLE
jgi:hypothetical protein